MASSEAARALTGWTVDDNGQFAEVATRHDDGEKTLLGKKGKWKGDDLVKMVLEHPATSQRLAFRICELLMGEGAIDATAVKALADGLRQLGFRDVAVPHREDSVRVA